MHPVNRWKSGTVALEPLGLVPAVLISSSSGTIGALLMVPELDFPAWGTDWPAAEVEVLEPFLKASDAVEVLEPSLAASDPAALVGDTVSAPVMTGTGEAPRRPPLDDDDSAWGGDSAGAEDAVPCSVSEKARGCGNKVKHVRSCGEAVLRDGGRARERRA